MKRFLLCAAITLCATASLAQQAGPRPELSAPIVVLTPVVAKNVDALKLTEAQRADVKNWVATMPAKRKAVEAAAIAARADLRNAIMAGAPVQERQKLAEVVGSYETKLVMARSNCVDHWREVLSPEQFAAALELAQVN